jgi:hypothetical protein
MGNSQWLFLLHGRRNPIGINVNDSHPKSLTNYFKIPAQTQRFLAGLGGN